MKKRIVKYTSIIPCLTGCFLFAAVLVNTGCKKNLIEYNMPPAVSERNADQNSSNNTSLDELVVWRRPGSTLQQFKDWLKGVEKGGKVVKNKGCACNDDSLMLLSGEGIKTFIQGNTVAGGQTSSTGTKSKATGGDGKGPVYYSLNFLASANPNASLAASRYKSYGYGGGSGTPVKVAVFDTGLDTTGLSNYLYKSTRSSCMPNAQAGYNFVANNSNYSDDALIKHGTKVTRLILDQMIEYKKNRIAILPVKTHNKNGVADLYSILCALAYAKERQVNIVNASFGFYVPRLELYGYPIDPNARLLREMVFHYLTKNHILLLAAAGNKDDKNELATFEQHKAKFPVLKYPKDLRNLGQVSFYPASLSRETSGNTDSFWNVITVTTVDTFNGPGKVSPLQNYSDSVVDIGVCADKQEGNDYVFIKALKSGNEILEGSSFSTPIATGKLAANYDQYKNKLALTNSKNKRQDIIVAMVNAKIFTTKRRLSTKIRNGRIARKIVKSVPNPYPDPDPDPYPY